MKDVDVNLSDLKIEKKSKDGFINGFPIIEWIGFLEVDLENQKTYEDNGSKLFNKEKSDHLEKWIKDLKSKI